MSCPRSLIVCCKTGHETQVFLVPCFSTLTLYLANQTMASSWREAWRVGQGEVSKTMTMRKKKMRGGSYKRTSCRNSISGHCRWSNAYYRSWPYFVSTIAVCGGTEICLVRFLSCPFFWPVTSVYSVITSTYDGHTRQKMKFSLFNF